jgi:hypothetical protein
MKKRKHYNGFASEEEYERVLAVAKEVIGNDADVIDVAYDCETISVITESGRYYIGMGDGVYAIELPDTFIDGVGLLVYEDLNDAEEDLYNALYNEED